MAQGTIKEFDLAAVTGSLLMDDRTEVAIDSATLAGSGIMTLRLGQRVVFDLDEADGAPVARTLRLVTFDQNTTT
jgi:cold shock CspA family protein